MDVFLKASLLKGNNHKLHINRHPHRTDTSKSTKRRDNAASTLTSVERKKQANIKRRRKKRKKKRRLPSGIPENWRPREYTPFWIFIMYYFLFRSQGNPSQRKGFRCGDII